jgi:YfiH family protein
LRELPEFVSTLPRTSSLRRVEQVHGSRVLVVDAPAVAGLCSIWEPKSKGRPPEGDALVSTGGGFCLAVLTADCAAVGLASMEGVHAAVHVGWRGLVAGVLERTVDSMRALGASQVFAGLGPCIHSCCYEFGAADLKSLTDRFGAGVESRTASGNRSFDLPRAVREALGASGARLELDLDVCTACSGDYFSFRSRRDEGRQALLVWASTN